MTIRENRQRLAFVFDAALLAWLAAAVGTRSPWVLFVPLAALGLAALVVAVGVVHALLYDDDPDLDEEG